MSNKKRQFLPFEEAREFIRAQKLTTCAEWAQFSKHGRPADIPSDPRRVYSKQWKGYRDWFGAKERLYLPFEEARAYTHTLNLKSMADWISWSQSGNRPSNIYSSPENMYAGKGWVNWGDWLGTGVVHAGKRKWRPFKEARQYARSLHLNTEGEWNVFVKSGKCPEDIPHIPRTQYAKQGWKSIGDWLGTSKVVVKKPLRPFEKARAFVRGLNLSMADWREYSGSGKLPADIPARPERTYANKGWIDLYDWLGTDS